MVKQRKRMLITTAIMTSLMVLWASVILVGWGFEALLYAVQCDNVFESFMWSLFILGLIFACTVMVLLSVGANSQKPKMLIRVAFGLEFPILIWCMCFIYCIHSYAAVFAGVYNILILVFTAISGSKKYNHDAKQTTR